MPGFDEIVSRATQRLRIDRELQLEVARELRDHLEDAAAEYEQSGLAKEAAEAEAAKAFGSADELGEQLWQANRSRIGFRYWTRWALRVSIVPVCLIVCGYFLFSSVLGIFNRPGLDLPLSTRIVNEQTLLQYDLTDDQQLIAYGLAGQDEAAAAKARHERWPDEPMYFANYLNQQWQNWNLTYRYDWNEETEAYDVTERPDEAHLAEFWAMVEKGKQLEPGNGYYDLWAAHVLFNHACAVREDESATVKRLSWPMGSGDRPTIKEEHPQKHDVLDEAKFREGLAAYARAADADYIEDYQIEFTIHQAAQLPGPQRMYELMFRLQRSMTVLLPGLGMSRAASRHVSAHAVQQAAAGEWEQSESLREDVDRVAVHVAEDSNSIIELVVALSIKSLALQTRYDATVAAGRDAEAARAWDAYRDLTVGFRTLQQGPGFSEDERHRSDLLMRSLLPAIAGLDVPLRPFREVEYALYDRIVLGALMLLLVSAAAVLMLTSGVLLLRGRRSGTGPALLWIGWGRLLFVTGVAVVLPLVVYGVYVWWPTFETREFSIAWSAGKVFAEYAILLAVMVMLIWHVGVEAVRRRAVEVGIDVPRWRWATQLPFLLLVALAIGLVVAMVWFFEMGSRPGHLPVQVSFIALPIGLLVLAVGLWMIRQLYWVCQPNISGGRIALQAALSVVLTCGAAAGGYVFGVWQGSEGEAVIYAWVMGSIAIAMLTLLAVLGMLSRGWRQPVFSGAMVRSLPPVLAAAALVVALVAGPMLSQMERARVQQIHEALGWPDFSYEVERSDYRYVKERLVTGEWPAEAKRLLSSAGDDGER